MQPFYNFTPSDDRINLKINFFQTQYFFFTALILLHVLFFCYALHSGNIYLHNDSDEYLHQAENIKLHHSWYSGDLSKPVNNYLISRRPPLNGFFIMATKSIFESDYAFLFFQNVFSIFNFFLLTKLLRLFGCGFKNKIAVLMLLLFFPTQLIYANMIMAEILFQTMLLCAFYFFIRFFQEKKTASFLLFHLFLTGAVLTKPVLYLFWIPLILFTVWLLIKKMIKPLQAGLAFIFPATIFLISFHNYNKTGYFHYSSVNENYLVNYSVYLTVADKEKGEEAEKKISEMMREAARKKSYHDYSVFIRQQSFHMIRDHLPSFIFLQIKGILNFFIDHGRWDIYAFFDKQPKENMKGWKYYYNEQGWKGAYTYLSKFPFFLSMYLIAVYVINIILLFSFMRFLTDKNTAPEIRTLAFIIVGYIAFATGMIGSARFRMAVYPFFILSFVMHAGWIFNYLKSLLYMVLKKGT